MAAGTYYLRPSADISVGHELFPTGSTNAYLLINEEVCDELATFIESGMKDATSKFQLSGSDQFEGSKVTFVNICGHSGGSSADLNHTFTLEIDSKEIGPWLVTGTKDFSRSVEDAIAPINDFLATNKRLPTINLVVLSSPVISGSKTEESYLSQVYVELGYETDINIRIKANGAWMAAISAYQKQNGVWAAITEDECKAILESSVLQRTYTLRNLVSDSSFENVSSNWNCWLAEPTDTAQAKNGTQSLKLGGDALAATQGTIPITIGHKYYGREYIKTSGELTADDCRFEVIGGTDTGEHSFVFGWNRGNFPEWTALSNVVTVDQAPASSYGLRTFTVNGSVDAWVDSIVLIDLTEAFGAGNEPTKEWCDANIPWFENEWACKV